MKSTDETVDHFLRETLHSTLQDLGGNNQDATTTDPVVTDPLCFPGLCAKDVVWEDTCRFSKLFHSQVSEKGVKVGSLLTVSVPDTSLFKAFFLGVALKKPLVQTILFVSMSDDRVNIKVDGFSVPIIWTTHHMFSEFLEATQHRMKACEVQQWLYTPTLDKDLKLFVSLDQELQKFELNLETKKGSTKKPVAKLPFGLSAQAPRKRKPQVPTCKVVPGVPKKPRTTHDAPLLDCQSQNPLLIQCEESDDDDCVAKTESDSDGESDNSHDEQAETNPNIDDVDVGDIEPISEVMEQEMKAAKTVAKEIEECDQTIQELTTEIETGKPLKTAFSTKLGLGSMSFAPTARAKCRSCNEVIPKGAVRFEWFWNKLRPNSWVHSHCLMQIAIASGLRQETLNSLENLASISAGSCADTNADDPLRLEAARVLSMF